MRLTALRRASRVFARYYGKFNKSRQNRWVFGDRQSGAYVHKFAWTHILRHWTVKHGASPDDPALADYWAWRQRKAPLPINKTTQELTNSQDGRCAICRGSLLTVENQPQTPSDWEKWRATRTAIITTATRPGSSVPRQHGSRSRGRIDVAPARAG